MSNNPILVEVTRGPLVESRHRGAISVVDGDAKSVLSVGDPLAPVFPRSAVKAIQALPVIETGAADAFGYGDKELALICSSHNGEPEHVARARTILANAGLDEACLECGGHWSSRGAVMRDQTRIYSQTPPAVCNNCSGKHSGFLATCAHLGIETKSYIHPEHEAMKLVRGVMEDLTGAAHETDSCGRDGCSIPTYAVPLNALALGFARMASGTNLSPQRAQAAKRLFDACMNEPWYVAGTKRFCTNLMELGAGRIFAKTGAEGVFCGAIPELGLGIALKADDGGTRAAEAMMAATVAHLLGKDDPLADGLAKLSMRTLRNWNGMHVGDLTVRLPS